MFQWQLDNVMESVGSLAQTIQISMKLSLSHILTTSKNLFFMVDFMRPSKNLWLTLHTPTSLLVLSNSKGLMMGSKGFVISINCLKVLDKSLLPNTLEYVIKWCTLNKE
jgi:hypothetical protein